MAWHQPGDKPLSEPEMLDYWCIYASLGLSVLKLCKKTKKFTGLNKDVCFYTEIKIASKYSIVMLTFVILNIKLKLWIGLLAQLNEHILNLGYILHSWGLLHVIQGLESLLLTWIDINPSMDK